MERDDPLREFFDQLFSEKIQRRIMASILRGESEEQAIRELIRQLESHEND